MRKKWSWIIIAVGFATSLALSHPAMATTVKVIYSFKGGADGAVPVGPLIQVGGTFYGTTSQGGGTGCGGVGCGTVFAIGPNGGERVIYRFAGSPNDGGTPLQGLVNIGGMLYGTTHDGGTHECGTLHCGTVFSIGINGGEKVLYSFKGGADGAFPDSNLIQIGTLFYGTTGSGGGHEGHCATNSSCGTLYSISASGKEKVVHAFAGFGSDGGNPIGDLIEIGNRIYGTTSYGGIAACYVMKSVKEGCGVAYSMTTDGGENILHEFNGYLDGAHVDGRFPQDGMIDVGGVLFGTTSQGGAAGICFGGCGTLFSMSIGGSETILHSFGENTKAGLEPGGLVQFGSLLYGVTYGGGGNGCQAASGCGIAFSASVDGSATVLHRFGGKPSDAELPSSRPIVFGQKLYGTSTHGGGGNCTGPHDSTGCGTVYQMTP
jgi:uncharacterized repeat protein (TIGR03803 family)